MSKADRLRELVARTIEEDPHDFEGFRWAAKSQAKWCRSLDISPATLRRLISKPPFVRYCRQVDGRKMTLLREGEPGPKTAEQLAKKMSNIWRKRFNRSVGRDDFGRLVGLAESWPDDHEVELFKLVLDNWPTFMAGVKVAIAAEGASGKELYLEYPSISVMRKFHEVAVEMHMILTGKSLTGRPLPLMA